MRKRSLVILLLLLVQTSAAIAAEKSRVPFRPDDYAGALAEAKAKKLPLFVEAWAPWCHSCRSMKAYVFTDKALDGYAEKFVWAAIDIEKPENAKFRKDFIIEGVPSFYIVDPADGKVAVRWLGGATVEQLTHILDDGAKAVKGKSEDRLRNALARADRIYGEGKLEDAAKAYQHVLSLAPAGWDRRARTIESLLFAYSTSRQNAPCAALAKKEYSRYRNTSAAMNIAALGLDCALSLEEGVDGRTELISTLEQHARETMGNAKVKVAADDRSGLYIAMITAREKAGDEEGTRNLLEEWAGFLEAEAAKAKTADARAVFDSHRLSAYLELGQPERAIPMLEASARDLPEDYNPPARLAVAYKAMKQPDAAVAAADRALAMAYGPRKLGIYRTKADALADKGDMEGARATLTEALQMAEALPDGQRSDRTIQALQEKLQELAKE